MSVNIALVMASTVASVMAVAQDLPEPKMELGNWIFLGAAWLSVTFLLVWSFVRVLTSPPGGSKPDAS